MVLTIACALSVGLAGGQPALAADVQINAGGLTVFPVAVENFDAMNVRIAGPSGALVLNEQSTGKAVVWYPTGMSLSSTTRTLKVVVIKRARAVRVWKKRRGPSRCETV